MEPTYRVFVFDSDPTVRWSGELPTALLAGLPDPAAEALRILNADTDGGVCMANVGPDENHSGIVGWRLDDERGQVQFAVFAIVYDGQRAWPICEDCWSLLLPHRLV
jgi:hypothetical protein